jgi:hypothetical protein
MAAIELHAHAHAASVMAFFVSPTKTTPPILLYVHSCPSDSPTQAGCMGPEASVAQVPIHGLRPRPHHAARRCRRRRQGAPRHRRGPRWGAATLWGAAPGMPPGAAAAQGLRGPQLRADVLRHAGSGLGAGKVWHRPSSQAATPQLLQLKLAAARVCRERDHC